MPMGGAGGGMGSACPPAAPRLPALLALAAAMSSAEGLGGGEGAVGMAVLAAGMAPATAGALPATGLPAALLGPPAAAALGLLAAPAAPAPAGSPFKILGAALAGRPFTAPAPFPLPATTAAADAGRAPGAGGTSPETWRGTWLLLSGTVAGVLVLSSTSLGRCCPLPPATAPARLSSNSTSTASSYTPMTVPCAPNPGLPVASRLTTRSPSSNAPPWMASLTASGPGL
mmetsp:Transcript_5227/g.12872  ORF Transcript_5227/g.12872 Transcript_5227/m.12872 type:complete len:229 (+) Transcript_5227:106-792(+)